MQDKDTSGVTHSFRGRAVVDAFMIHVAGGNNPFAIDASQLKSYFDALTSRENYVSKRRENLKRENTLIEVSDLDPHLQRMATLLKGLGKTLYSSYGAEAEAMLDAILEEWTSIIDSISDKPDEMEEDDTYRLLKSKADAIEDLLKSQGIQPPPSTTTSEEENGNVDMES